MSAEQTRREERFNTLTHGLMAVMIALALLSVLSGMWRAKLSVIIFCLCMILMFTTSAIYHILPAYSRSKHLFHRFDHISIYFAIAGTYTPVALSIIGGSAGRTLILIEWSLVIAGIIFKILAFRHSRLTEIISTTVYLLMGWAIVPWLPVFISRADPGCVMLIVSGGLFYTAGVVFFALNRKYAHTIWHLFVNAGAICHFLAIAFFAG
jgi:hemolysin III